MMRIKANAKRTTRKHATSNIALNVMAKGNNPGATPSISLTQTQAVCLMERVQIVEQNFKIKNNENCNNLFKPK